MTDDTPSAEDRWPVQAKAAVLREAVAATGGPHSEALAAVRNYVDRRYPDFPWTPHWWAEISGAKAALKGQSPAADTAPDAPPAPRSLDEADIRRAKDLVERVGEGSVERVREMLAAVAEMGDIERLREAVEVWSELLESVNGEAEVAERVLGVVGRRFLDTQYPRLAKIAETAPAANEVRDVA